MVLILAPSLHAAESLPFSVSCHCRLGANKERYSWFREAELTNGR